MANVTKNIKKFFRQFFLINDSPHKIAAGAALGMFLGIIPGAGILAALVLSSVFRFNRLAASSMSVAVNLWSSFAILPLAAGLGGFLFNIDSKVLIENFQTNYDLGWKTFLEESIFISLLLPLIIGFFLVSAIISLGFYFFLFYLLKNKNIKLK